MLLFTSFASNAKEITSKENKNSPGQIRSNGTNQQLTKEFNCVKEHETNSQEIKTKVYLHLKRTLNQSLSLQFVVHEEALDSMTKSNNTLG